MLHTLAVTINGAEAAIIIVVVIVVFFVYAGFQSRRLQLRKAEITAGREDELRQLVAQQRVAADVSELRSRTTSIEQILRTVE
jgi:Tfp pilus assembly protein PilO